MQKRSESKYPSKVYALPGTNIEGAARIIIRQPLGI